VKTLDDARDRELMLGRLTAFRPDSTRRWGRMTAHQMVCHLADNFRMALGERRVAPTTGLMQRTLLKWFVLYVPVPWPAGIPTSPEVDQERGGTPPTDFATDLRRAEELLLRATADPERLERQAHPVFGPMSRGDWLRWAWLHTDHHLRQFGR
jgi:hypothetical protein